MATIAEALDVQLHNLRTLQHLLESELYLISSRDAEGLMNLLNDKQATLDAIQQQDEITNQLFAAQGKNAKFVIANQPPEVRAQLDEAQQLLEQCKFRTSVNEKAVEQGQLKLEHLRHLLIETRAKESLTYDRSGKPQGGSLGKGVSA